MTTPKEVVDRILQLSLEHPSWGCVRLSHTLQLEGISVSSPTVQNILIKNGMAFHVRRYIVVEHIAVTIKPMRIEFRQNTLDAHLEQISV